MMKTSDVINVLINGLSDFNTWLNSEECKNNDCEIISCEIKNDIPNNSIIASFLNTDFQEDQYRITVEYIKDTEITNNNLDITELSAIKYCLERIIDIKYGKISLEGNPTFTAYRKILELIERDGNL